MFCNFTTKTNKHVNKDKQKGKQTTHIIKHERQDRKSVPKHINTMV